MLRQISFLFAIVLGALAAGGEMYAAETPAAITAVERSGVGREALTVRETISAGELQAAKKSVVVIPVRDQIDTPSLFIIRRGLKAEGGRRRARHEDSGWECADHARNHGGLG